MGYFSVRIPLLGFVSDVAVFLAHTHHHSLMPGATDDGREDSTRRVVSCESGFAHTGSVVNNQCGDFIFHG